jgi:hypothetical protein
MGGAEKKQQWGILAVWNYEMLEVKNHVFSGKIIEFAGRFWW